jgi:hypothetical protein
VFNLSKIPKNQHWHYQHYWCWHFKHAESVYPFVL